MTTEPTVPSAIPMVTLTLPDGTRRVLDEASFVEAAKAGFEPESLLELPDGRKYKRVQDGSWAEDTTIIEPVEGSGRWPRIDTRPPNRRERRANEAIKRKKK